MLHCTPVWSGPRTPVALVRATRSPREAVCAVAYSQLSPEPPIASSLHCWRAGCVESIAQKDVTIMLAVSMRPTRQEFRHALLLADPAFRLIGRPRIDVRDERRDAAVEAALRPVDTAVELADDLRPAGAGIGRLALRLGGLLALEQPGRLLGHALRLARQALRLLGRRGTAPHEHQPNHHRGGERARASPGGGVQYTGRSAASHRGISSEDALLGHKAALVGHGGTL
jgi:hypothetical protein